MSKEIRRGLYGRMALDSTLNGLLHAPPAGYAHSIFHEMAPPEAVPPYVIFFKSAGTPTYSMKPNGAAFDSEVWLIKGVDRNTSADPVDAISSRLDALLTDATLSISGRSLMDLRRELDVEYSEGEKGTLYRHAGAQFRLVSQPS